MSLDRGAPIFVAGHGGLIGSAVHERLLKESCGKILTRTRAELDLMAPAAVESFFRQNRPRVVVLAAGRVGGIMENKTYPADFMVQNLAIQQNVLTAAHAHGVERLVFFGSSCMYPKVCPQPMREDQLMTGPVEPTSQAYAFAKFAGVEMCLAFNRQFGKKKFLPVIPNNVYGPRDDFDPASSHVLSGLMKKMHDAKAGGRPSVQLWGTGTPRREFIYAGDVADAVWHILNSDVEKLEFPLNIGTGRDHSIQELAAAIQKTVGADLKIEWDTSKPDGAPQKLLDSSRLLATGWQPRTKFEDGLKQTYDWFVKESTLSGAHA